MLIVITQDKNVIQWCKEPQSKASRWGALWVITEGGAPTATVLLKRYLNLVQPNEPLCITGHGNNFEIGDENQSGKLSWAWGVDEFVGFLDAELPENFSGPILLEVCADSRTNFAFRLAHALFKVGRKNIWVFGYAGEVHMTHVFPDPDSLSANPELTKDNSGDEELERRFSDLELINKVSKISSQDTSSPSSQQWKPLTLQQPSKNTADYNIPAQKWYVFNETGNIMIATTEPDTSKIDPSVRNVFEEVAVFFAALTKAITSTPRPGAKEPYAQEDYYTIYDYVALESIVNRSGLFVNVHREDIQYSTTSITATFNIEFIEAVLGVVLTDGIGAAALMSSLNAMGKQATFSYNSSGKAQEIGNLLFVCEYLFGMPIVNVLYFYLDETETTTVVKASPCVTISDKSFKLKIHKDTFLFVLPEWIKKYAGNLASVADDPDYQQLVKQLESYISNNPVALSVYDGITQVTELTDGKSYKLLGLNLGAKLGKIYIGETEQTVGASGWSTDGTSVTFTAKKPTSSGGGGPIVVKTDDNKVTSGIDSYTFA
jgi:hypothetical protein